MFRLWLHTLVKWDGGESHHLVYMLFFVLSLIAPLSYCHVPSNHGDRQLEQGCIGALLLAPLLARVSAFSLPK